MTKSYCKVIALDIVHTLTQNQIKIIISLLRVLPCCFHFSMTLFSAQHLFLFAVCISVPVNKPIGGEHSHIPKKKKKIARNFVIVDAFIFRT